MRIGWIRRKYLVRDRLFEELSDGERSLVRKWYSPSLLANLSGRRFNIFTDDDPLVMRGRSPVSLILCGPRRPGPRELCETE